MGDCSQFAKWTLSEGWALAYRSQSLAFIEAEDAAREGAKGIWTGAFKPPSIWRKKHQMKPIP
jgi:endonuclease YncB( thermonuclease family)